MTDYNISQLANQNIWWDDPLNISNDITIQKYDRMFLKFYPRVIQNLDFGKDNIYIIRGPRQVGKTTALKLLIKSMLSDKKIPAIALFYYTCDAVETYRDLLSLLETYLNYARLTYSGELFIFLDEISDIENWQKSIKFLVDTGKLRNTTIFLTGSNAYDLTHSSERLPGRRGPGPNLDRMFYPLTFGEYLSLVDDKLETVIEKLGPFNIESIDEIVKTESFRSLIVHKPRLDLFFDQYLLTGGFITAIRTERQTSCITF